ncbi:MAG TPA: L17 family ribosomal protein [Candidatus Dojkabacteria bacterium]|mgnify:CR=1 FL=1|nr:L17 family ribosomal protein [Candidatus Dojkabacteria bacterium]HQF36614.1 L17 family ribosomal protein [Candidatus Dojkabacteria bacterium]
MKSRRKFYFGQRKGVHERMVVNQFISLALNGSLSTTGPKSKALKSFADIVLNKIATMGDDVSQKRNIESMLKHNLRMDDIFKLYSGIEKREGSYTSIDAIGKREGDNSEIYRISVIDFDKIVKKNRKKVKKD